jgi:hypothetical protein
MKDGETILTGNGIINGYTFLLLFVNVIIILLLDISVSSYVLLLLIFNLFGIIILYGRFYSFIYNNKELCVRHLWSGIKVKYKLDDLSQIELKRVPKIGKVIIVKEKSGKKRGFGASVINIQSLEMMVKDINRELTK